jgi:hypothetical protein
MLLALPYLWIGCVGTLAIPVLLIVASPAVYEEIAQAVHPRTFALFLTCLAMLIWSGGYVLYGLIGYGLWRLRLWAHKSAVVLHWIFIGITVVAVAISARFDLLLSLFVGISLVAFYGGVLYYLSRPRVRWPFEATAAIAKRQPIPPPPPARTTPTWMLVTSITTAILVGIALFAVGLFSLIEKSFRSSTPYAMALDRAQSSPCIAKTFGQPIVAKGFISGNLSTNNDSGEAELEIPIHGPKVPGIST